VGLVVFVIKMSDELNEHLTILFPSGSPKNFASLEKERKNFKK